MVRYVIKLETVFDDVDSLDEVLALIAHTISLPPHSKAQTQIPIVTEPFTSSDAHALDLNLRKVYA
jgi:hypothetical protein